MFLLYGVTGYVGSAIARLAAEAGLEPIVAGRDSEPVAAAAAHLGVPHRVFSVTDTGALEAALSEVCVVLNLAGPYLPTAEAIAPACVRTGTQYLAISGELPAYQRLLALHEAAVSAGVMLMPSVGFDVVPTDCLAAYLHRRLPEATHLELAFNIMGPAGMPPGTARTFIENAQNGTNWERRDGELVRAKRGNLRRSVDFGEGPRTAHLLPWGDLVTAHRSTGIPNIAVYAALPPALRRQISLMEVLAPLLRFEWMRALARRSVKPGASETQRSATRMHVWGQVRDAAGNHASARLHGPEGGSPGRRPASCPSCAGHSQDRHLPGSRRPLRPTAPTWCLSTRASPARTLPDGHRLLTPSTLARFLVPEPCHPRFPIGGRDAEGPRHTPGPFASRLRREGA
jgi:short subunit dehydrogenase-like uncharacterized protein